MTVATQSAVLYYPTVRPVRAGSGLLTDQIGGRRSGPISRRRGARRLRRFVTSRGRRVPCISELAPRRTKGVR